MKRIAVAGRMMITASGAEAGSELSHLTEEERTRRGLLWIPRIVFAPVRFSLWLVTRPIIALAKLGGDDIEDYFYEHLEATSLFRRKQTKAFKDELLQALHAGRQHDGVALRQRLARLPPRAARLAERAVRLRLLRSHRAWWA